MSLSGTIECLVNYQALKREMSTGDTISDLAIDLEGAKSAGDTAYVVFLDVTRAPDSLPHVSILRQIRAYGITGRIN